MSQSDNPIPCERCGQPHPRCKGHRKDGNPCTQWPRRGAAVCKRHGGGAPQVIAAAKRRVEQASAVEAVETYGLPREVAPDVALLEEVHRSAGHVAWLGDVVARLEVDDVVWGMTEQVERSSGEFPGVDTTHKAAVNVWVQLYQSERKHLAAVCKSALDAGIAERQVRLAEQQGALVAQVIRGILDDLDLTVEQQARVGDVVPRRLRAVAIGGPL